MYMQIYKNTMPVKVLEQLFCYTLVLRYGCHLLFCVCLVCTPRPYWASMHNILHCHSMYAKQDKVTDWSAWSYLAFCRAWQTKQVNSRAKSVNGIACLSSIAGPHFCCQWCLLKVSNSTTEIPVCNMPKHPCTLYITASSPCLPRLFVAALDVKAGRPGRFWDVRLRQVDTNVASCQPNI